MRFRKEVEKKDVYTAEEVENIKSNTTLRTLLICVLYFIIIGSMLIMLILFHTPLYRVGLPEDLRKLVTIYDYYLEDYVNEVDATELVDGALKGMGVVSEDKYGNYINAKNSETTGKMFKEGHYFGIGIGYNEHSTYIEIKTIRENSPAEKVGLCVGDKIIKINGIQITESNIDTLREQIRDVDGVEFTLQNGKVIFVKAGEVDIPKIDLTIKDDIGFLSIHTFVPDTYDLFKSSIEEIVKSDVKELVIDLRDNGGGDVDAAVKMLDCMMSEGMIAKLDYKSEKREDEVYMADNDCVYNKNIPITIVAGPNTASASELFIMCLQDNFNAKLCGQKTYGKSTILSAIEFTDGSIFIMSVGKCKTISDRDIEGKGISPDILVPKTLMDLSVESVYNLYIK